MRYVVLLVLVLALLPVLVAAPTPENNPNLCPGAVSGAGGIWVKTGNPPVGMCFDCGELDGVCPTDSGALCMANMGGCDADCSGACITLTSPAPAAVLSPGTLTFRYSVTVDGPQTCRVEISPNDIVYNPLGSGFTAPGAGTHTVMETVAGQVDGNYYWRVRCSSTSITSLQRQYSVVGASGSISVTLSMPQNWTWFPFNGMPLNYEYRAIHSAGLPMTCTIHQANAMSPGFVGPAINTRVNVASGALITVPSTAPADGWYNWRVTCTESSLTGISHNNTFFVGYGNWGFISVTNIAPSLDQIISTSSPTVDFQYRAISPTGSPMTCRINQRVQGVGSFAHPDIEKAYSAFSSSGANRVLAAVVIILLLLLQC